MTTQAPSKTGGALGGHVARILLGLAIADGVGTSSGIFTGEPRGDTQYAVYAFCATAAAWWLAGRRSPLPRLITSDGRPTRVSPRGRLVVGASVVALHAQAAVAAVKPAALWPVPEALTTVMAIPVAVACGVALLALRERES